MKYYLIQDGWGGEKVIQAKNWPKVEEMSNEMELIALKAGKTKMEAESYRWKIVKEIDCK